MQFFVEGRYFPDPLTAFTFAWIQADRMERAVEIRMGSASGPWHGTAQPSNYVRSHVVTKTAPMELSAAASNMEGGFIGDHLREAL